jgi:hypothetical protein
VFRYLLVFVILFFYGATVHGEVSFSAGFHYSSFHLFADDAKVESAWGPSVEVGIHDFIPRIGLKLSGGKVRYETPFEFVSYNYEYIPITLCSSFDMLPFWEIESVDLILETGFGFYFWKALRLGQVVELPTGEKIDERDYGFVGGFTLQVQPHRNLGIGFVTRFNYITSSDIYKYGFYDKDEKLWENGLSVTFILY